MLSHSPAYEETYISPTGRVLPPPSMMHTAASLNNRRTVSDPFGDLAGFANRRTERPGDIFLQSGCQPTFRGGQFLVNVCHFFNLLLLSLCLVRPGEAVTGSPFHWRSSVEKTGLVNYRYNLMTKISQILTILPC